MGAPGGRERLLNLRTLGLDCRRAEHGVLHYTCKSANLRSRRIGDVGGSPSALRMGASTGRDECTCGKDEGPKWKAWVPLLETMGDSTGQHGCLKWIFMGASSARNFTVSAANGQVSCAGWLVAYVVYVVLNVLVCLTGMTGFGRAC